MKNCILKLKQYFCLMLSIVLLSANVQIFAQGVPEVQEELKYLEVKREYSNLIDEIRKSKIEFQDLCKRMKGDIDRGKSLQHVYMEYFDDIESYKTRMGKIFGEYQEFLTKISYAKKYVINETAKDVAERLSYKYTGIPKAYPELMIIYNDGWSEEYVMKKFQGLTPKNLISKMDAIDYAYSDLLEISFKNYHDFDNMDFNAWRYDEKVANTLKEIKPEEIFKRAMEKFNDEELSAIGLTAEARQGKNLLSIVRKLKRHIRTFGIKSTTNKLTLFGLIKALKPLSQAERAKYIEDLTGLNQGQKQLLKDVFELDDAAVTKSITKFSKNANKGFRNAMKTGALIGIGALLTIISINDLKAATTFEDVIDPVEPEDNILFYGSDESESYVMNDAFHMLKLLETAEIVAQANDFAKGMTKDTTAQVEDTVLDYNFEINIPGIESKA